jgi:hypothetical protein
VAKVGSTCFMASTGLQAIVAHLSVAIFLLMESSSSGADPASILTCVCVYVLAPERARGGQGVYERQSATDGPKRRCDNGFWVLLA